MVATGLLVEQVFDPLPAPGEGLPGIRRAKHSQPPRGASSRAQLGMLSATSIPFGRFALLADSELLQRVA
jgi:hypothetical protein